MSMVVNNLERKVTKIGRSYGITIPLDMLKEHGIKPGDTVSVTGKDGEISFKKSRKVDLPDGISSDFFEVLERNTQKHDETLKGLIDR
ncbi:AbrB/MazE/SpoVT family DNA-binding domain-containing protein [Bacillus piscicola]|uniref:AbrB/MazE/SpoVT family DNA-binding domain-containing protein n=1 Tax=Bacillus piscicola TaxID=1632684 RepID=UPI001F09B22A|nr:AbrB/MazE/SpoVT family DNA-binding domain-containing protein [Bacillus piscicola]